MLLGPFVLFLSVAPWANNLRQTTLQFRHEYVSPLQRSRALAAIGIELRSAASRADGHMNTEDVALLLDFCGSGIGLQPTAMDDILKGVSLVRSGCAMRDHFEYNVLWRREEPADLVVYIESAILMLLSYEKAVRVGNGEPDLFSESLREAMVSKFGDEVRISQGKAVLPPKLLKALPFEADLSIYFGPTAKAKYHAALLDATRAANEGGSELGVRR